jgi:regulator of replication initiation timing
MSEGEALIAKLGNVLNALKAPDLLNLHDLWIVQHRLVHELPVDFLGSHDKAVLHDAHEALHDQWFQNGECPTDKRNCSFVGDWFPRRSLFLGLRRGKNYADLHDVAVELADEVARLKAEAERLGEQVQDKDAEIERLKGAEERCETWKAQAGRDQIENRVLKARLAGAHVTNPGQDDADNFPAPTLIEFLREAARNAKEGTWGMWRAKEFDQAADRLRELYESYLYVCPHEAEVEQLREVLKQIRQMVEAFKPDLYDRLMELFEAALSGAAKTEAKG